MKSPYTTCCVKTETQIVWMKTDLIPWYHIKSLEIDNNSVNEIAIGVTAVQSSFPDWIPIASSKAIFFYLKIV